MMNGEHKPPRVRKKFGTIWGELDYLCKRIHYWWYTRRGKASAKRYLSRLERVLNELPENDLAIVREEGLAWLHQLKGENSLAIPHRQREIELMELAHEDVRQSVKAGRYDESMATSILAGRDAACLEERRAMLEALIGEENSSKAEEK
jgi:hypothetical protein